MIHVEIDWFHPVNCGRIDCLLPAITYRKFNARQHHPRSIPCQAPPSPVATAACNSRLQRTPGVQGVPQKFVELRATSPKPKTKLEKSCDVVVHVTVENYKWQGCVCKRNTWTKYTLQCWLSTKLLMIIMIFVSMNH